MLLNCCWIKHSQFFHQSFYYVQQSNNWIDIIVYFWEKRNDSSSSNNTRHFQHHWYVWHFADKNQHLARKKFYHNNSLKFQFWIGESGSNKEFTFNFKVNIAFDWDDTIHYSEVYALYFTLCMCECDDANAIHSSINEHKCVQSKRYFEFVSVVLLGDRIA